MLRAEQRGVSAAGRPKALLGWEGCACWTLGHLKPLLLVGRFPFNGGYFVFLYEVWAEHGGYLWEGFCSEPWQPSGAGAAGGAAPIPVGTWAA